ncbi:MAG: ATP-binding protein [Thermomicrobiales bacterium]
MAGDPQLESSPFGELLREHRLAADLTQEALAERAGLSARGISDLERGARSHPYRETLNLLVSALGLTGIDRAAFLTAARRQGKPVASVMSNGEIALLPLPLNRLVDRQDELAAVSSLLREGGARMVTLTGPAGVGKTRLALAVAVDLADAFPDGVVFVDLAPLRNPDRVLASVASALGLAGHKALPVLETVRRYLAPRRILLVLDNFEHLMEAAPIVSDVVRAGPGIVTLITSREPLRLHGEREYVVSTLDLPALGVDTPHEELAASPAVRLFVERAVDAESDFRASPENIAIAAAICHRLDGLPLAIELAAPRLKVLPPASLLVRLEQRLPLLTSGPRDAPVRQRTLRDAIAWSYELLAPHEQTLFRQLGAFVGGWSLEAAEAVTEGRQAAPIVLDTLASLIDKSLVRLSDARPGPRYTMLETLREYALERLQADRSEECAIRQAHADFFRDMSEGARAGLVGPDQVAWLTRLDSDDANILAALTWTIENDEPAAGMRFASNIWRYWATRGRLSEGRDWLERALSRAGADDVPPVVRADAHNALGNLVGDMGEYPAARRHYEEALALRRTEGDAAGVAGALNNLGLIAAWLGDYDEARALHGESLELRRSLGDALGEAQSLSNLGDVSMAQGDLNRAGDFQQQALALREAGRDAAGSAYARYNLGEIARLRGDVEEAEQLLLESHRRFEALGDKLGIAYAQWSLGDVASRQDDRTRAADLLDDALQTRLEMGDKRGVIECLEAVGVAALRHGADMTGVRLLGMARAQRELISCPVPPSTQAQLERELAHARQRQGNDAVDQILRNPGLSAPEEALRLAHEALDVVAG